MKQRTLTVLIGVSLLLTGCTSTKEQAPGSNQEEDSVSLLKGIETTDTLTKVNYNKIEVTYPS